MDLCAKEWGSNCKINSCLNNSVEKLRLKEIIGSLCKFFIIRTAVSSHGLTLLGNGERSDGVGFWKLSILRSCIAQSSI